MPRRKNHERLLAALTRTAPLARSAARAAVMPILLAGAPAEARPAQMTSSERYSFQIVGQEVREVLRIFASSIKMPISIDDGISGQVSGLNGTFTAIEFLDAVTMDHGLSWFLDGDTIVVTPSSDSKSILIDFSAVSARDLNAALDDLGLLNDRFPIRQGASDGVGLLTGPKHYVDLVSNTFDVLAARRADPPAAVALPEAPKRAHEIVVIRRNSVQIWRGATVQTETPPAPEEEPRAPPENS